MLVLQGSTVDGSGLEYMAVIAVFGLQLGKQLRETKEHQSLTLTPLAVSQLGNPGHRGPLHVARQPFPPTRRIAEERLAIFNFQTQTTPLNLPPSHQKQNARCPQFQ